MGSGDIDVSAMRVEPSACRLPLWLLHAGFAHNGVRATPNPVAHFFMSAPIFSLDTMLGGCGLDACKGLFTYLAAG